MNFVLGAQIVRHRALHIAQFLRGATVEVGFMCARTAGIQQQQPSPVVLFIQPLQGFKLLAVAFAAQAGEFG